MNPAVRIRPSTAADTPALVRIWQDSVRATHHFLSPAHYAEIAQRAAREYLPFAAFWVADAEGGIQGFLGQDGRFVASLFIAPAARGQGIGKALLDHARAFAGGPLAVDVNEQNAQAVGFYLHLGFVPVGRTACGNTGRPYPVLHLQEPLPDTEAMGP